MELGTGERKRGLWTDDEDKILMKHVELYGKGQWNRIAKKTGLKRCGKSCRLRWVNYLSPSVKKGSFTEEEEDLIIRLHKLLGNRWSLIAGRVPGRTDNQVKNYWNTHLCKRNGCGKKQRTKSCTPNTDKNSVTCSKDSETRTSCSSLASLTNLGGNIITTGKTHNVEQDNKATENSVIDDASLLPRNTDRFVTDGEDNARSSAWKDQVDKEMMSSFVPFPDEFLQFDFGWGNMSSRFSNN